MTEQPDKPKNYYLFYGCAFPSSLPQGEIRISKREVASLKSAFNRTWPRRKQKGLALIRKHDPKAEIILIDNPLRQAILFATTSETLVPALRKDLFVRVEQLQDRAEYDLHVGFMTKYDPPPKTGPMPRG